MALALNRLTARQVATLSKPGRHADGGGLYLQVDASGARRWVFLYRWKADPSQPGTGKLREMGLGSGQTLSLFDARSAAEKARKMVADGLDPIAQKKASKASEMASAVTFGKVAAEYITAHEGEWRNPKHRDQWRMTLSVQVDGAGAFLDSGYCISVRDKAVADITTEDVLGVLAPIWSEKPETAARVRGRIEAVLDSARVKGLRTGENPARWKGHLAHLLSKRTKLARGHHAAMVYSDVPAFIQKLRLVRGMASLALEFTILTAARTGEVLGATWAEFDLEKGIWVIPAGRMKGGREHRVPLGGRALEILLTAKQIDHTASSFIFPGARHGRPLSGMAMEMVLRRHAPTVTVHGFRSAFRDWAGDATSFPREVAEAALAHATGSETELAYRRGDALQKRRMLMEAWNNFLSLVPSGNVVSIRQEAGHHA